MDVGRSSQVLFFPHPLAAVPLIGLHSASRRFHERRASSLATVNVGLCLDAPDRPTRATGTKPNKALHRDNRASGRSALERPDRRLREVAARLSLHIRAVAAATKEIIMLAPVAK